MIRVMTLGIALMLAIAGATPAGRSSPQHEPIQILVDVPDEPLWQAAPTETVPLTLAGRTDYPVPHIDEWATPFFKVNPVFVEKEGESLVLYGVHGRPAESSSFKHSSPEEREINPGVNRWVIGTDEMEVREFPDFPGGFFCFFGADLKDHPGPEYFRPYSTWLEGEPGYGRLLERTFRVFGCDGTQIASIDSLDLYPSFDIINHVPIDYPNISAFMIQVSGINRLDIQVYDFADGCSAYADPRNNPDDPIGVLDWIAATGEWFYSEKRTIDGLERKDIIAEAEDGSIVHFEPWTWPGYSPDQEQEDSAYFPAVPPVFIDGHRHLLLRTYNRDFENGTQRWWLIKFDPGQPVEPVWYRDEPNMIYNVERILILGRGERPYMMRFGWPSEVVRVIDLVSGECVISERIDVAPIEQCPEGAGCGNRACPAYCLGDNRTIPAIFIFDPNGGNLIRIDLETEQ